MVVVPNPAWPVADVQVDTTTGPPSIPGASRQSLLRPGVAVTQISVNRGRQYERSLCEAGTATVKVKDPKEYLNPSNGSSPFQTGSGRTILPYRSMWIPVLWPNTGNLLNPNVRTTYDPSFESSVGSNPGSWAPVGGTTTCATSTVQHFQGSKSMLVTQSAAGSGFGAGLSFRHVPRFTYTCSCYVYPTGGCSVQLQVTLGDGTTVSSAVASTQNTWTRLTASWTAVDTLETVTVYGTGATTPTWYLDAYQLEWGASASTFTVSGPTLYSLYTGFVERWPQTWRDNGFWGVRPLECVDALGPISRAKISQSYLATIQGDSPLLYLPLTDTAPPGVFTIGGANYGSSPSPSGNNNGSFGWGGDTFLDGTRCLTMSQRNPSSPPAPGTGATQLTEWNLSSGTLAVPTAGFTIEVWFKYSSGQVTPLQLGIVTDGATFQPDQQYIAVTSSYLGVLLFYVQDTTVSLPRQGNVLPLHSQGYADDNWHYLALTLASSNQLFVTFDGTETGAVLSPTLPAYWGANNIHFDVYSGNGDALSQMSLFGWAAYNRDIGSSTRQAHYQRGIGHLGELSGTRVARLCSAYWSGGATSIAAGFVTLAEDYTYNTRTLLEVLYEIADTEGGLLYADRNGTLVWEDRSSRYASQTSTATFGDGVGELPYEDLQYDFDPTYVFSETDLSRPGNTGFAPQTNSTSLATYGQRILQTELQVTSDYDLNQASLFYLQRYGNPKPRIRTLTLNPLGNANMWPTVLGLEISKRVTVKRRVNGVTMSADYYIEHIGHRVDLEQDPPSWTVEVQLSPVFVPSAWVMGDATYGVMGVTTIPVY